MASQDPTRSTRLEEFSFNLPVTEKQRLREIRGQILANNPSEDVSLSDLGREMARLYIEKYEDDPAGCSPLKRGGIDPSNGSETGESGR